MGRHKKNKPRNEEIIVETEHPKEELAVEQPIVEQPVVEEPKDLGFLGPNKVKILSEEKVIINEKEYTKLFLEDKTTVVLNEQDLLAQRV